jgi:23S rRNA (guanosine2251-2'-O)-methyltransferase
LDSPIALVLGAEGVGLHKAVRKACDALVRLPMRGPIASINVSAAAAVALFEARRQRG